MPSKLCPQCGCMKREKADSKTEWKRVDTDNNHVGNCKTCMDQHKADNCPCQCTKCFIWKPETAFPEHKRHVRASNDRVCEDCIDIRKCKSCNIKKPEQYFTHGEWLLAAWQSSDRGKCRDCMGKSEKTCGHVLVAEKRSARLLNLASGYSNDRMCDAQQVHAAIVVKQSCGKKRTRSGRNQPVWWC